MLPKPLYKKGLSLVHQNHRGIEKPKHMLRESVWWPNMNKDVEDLVKTCLFCQAVTPSSQFKPLNPIYMLSHQWQDLYMSLWGPLPIGEYIFTVTDAYSRYPETVFLKDTSSKSLINELVDIFQTRLTNDIENWQWPKPCFSRNEKLLMLQRNPSCKIGNLLAKK